MQIKNQKRIILARTQKGLSRAEFARAMGLDWKTVQFLEVKGITSERTLKDACEFLGLSVEDFIPESYLVK